MRVRSAAAVVATEERTPPAEFQLWQAGPNPTDYGVHVWNARSISSVLERYNARGNPLLVDVEHNGATLENGEPAVTGGYARLEVRGDAPYLVFDWSDYGRQQIESGQRRFLSPEYDVDKDTGEILALYRVSLVADPGTHRARMLAAALKEAPMDLQVILAALRAALAAEDPAVAKESIANLLAELQKSAGGGDAGDAANASTASDDGDKAPPSPSAGAMAASDDGGDKSTDDKDKTQASAPPKACAAAAPAKGTQAPDSAQAVTVAAGAAVLQIKNAQRDHLIATQGDRLEPSIRRWASSQPLEVVKGLLDATPAKGEGAVKRAAATRGVTQGTAQKTPAEQAEADEMDRSMGIRTSAYRAPFRRESDGAWVHPVNRPSDVRAQLAAKAAEKGA